MSPTTTTAPRGTTVAGAGAPTSTSYRPLPKPVRSSALVTDVAAVAAGITLVVIGLWVRDGGLRALLEPGTARWTSLSQITGLTASGAGLARVLGADGDGDAAGQDGHQGAAGHPRRGCFYFWV